MSAQYVLGAVPPIISLKSVPDNNQLLFIIIRMFIYRMAASIVSTCTTQRPPIKSSWASQWTIWPTHRVEQLQPIWCWWGFVKLNYWKICFFTRAHNIDFFSFCFSDFCDDFEANNRCEHLWLWFVAAGRRRSHAKTFSAIVFAAVPIMISDKLFFCREISLFLIICFKWTN